MLSGSCRQADVKDRKKLTLIERPVAVWRAPVGARSGQSAPHLKLQRVDAAVCRAPASGIAGAFDAIETALSLSPARGEGSSSIATQSRC